MNVSKSRINFSMAAELLSAKEESGSFVSDISAESLHIASEGYKQAHSYLRITNNSIFYLILRYEVEHPTAQSTVVQRKKM